LNVPLRAIFVVVGWAVLAFLVTRVSSTASGSKLYDPYEILDIKKVRGPFAKARRVNRFLILFPSGYHGEGDQVTVQETFLEIVRPMYAERFETIDPPRSHPDKVRLAINQTAEEVAAKFVEITKAYKSSVGCSLATSLCLNLPI